MALNARGLLNAAAAHAAASGWFDKVNRHEALNVPGRGLSCSLWVQRLRPVAEMSGLNSTTALLVLTVRISSSASKGPQDDLDPAMLDAADALITAYVRDFSLGDLVEYVDIHGRHGVALDSNAGWIKLDGNSAVRIFDITLPLVIRNLWAQAE